MLAVGDVAQQRIEGAVGVGEPVGHEFPQPEPAPDDRGHTGRVRPGACRPDAGDHRRRGPGRYGRHATDDCRTASPGPWDICGA
ncbi:hypothetical protein G6F22_021160 [Rhizopus arrhizus]|nr:hypothetical protein G6F22_021160 [Rhizopus arrhizus]